MQKITQETPDSIIEGTPVSEIPDEIKNYYAKHKYGYRGIPFSAKTVKKIAKILESGQIPEEDLAEYDKSVNFENLTPFPNAPLW